MAMGSEAKRAQRWEAPASPPQPRPRTRRRRLKPWVSIGLGVSAAFVMALGAAWSGAMMARMGFEVDQMQAQLTSAQRARQALQDEVVSLTGAARLASEAHRLGVPVSPLVLARPAPPGAPAPAAAPRTSVWERVRAAVSSWIARIRGVQGGRQPAPDRSVHQSRT